MRKFISLLTFICLAASMSADDVTFTLINGSNASWVNSTWENLKEGGKWQTNPSADAWLLYEATESTYIQGYTITLANSNKSDGQLPYTWNVMGSNDEGDSKNWTLIHSQAQADNIVEEFDARANINNRSYTFYCNSSVQYKYYKFNITGKSQGSWGSFEISGFNLIPSSVGFSCPGNNIMDGTTTTKLYGNVPQTVVITSTAPTTIKGYQFTTANDTQSYSGRNPKSWKLEGSNNNIDWVVVDTKTNCSVMEGKNYYPYTFVLPEESASYSFYRLTFTGVQSGEAFQLSEVALITDLTACTNGIYEINSETDLITFADIVSGGKESYGAFLTKDLDMDGTGFSPIGTDANRFRGFFNGQGHSINLNIQAEASAQGLFGYATDGARFSNFIITGQVSGAGSCASLIGEGHGDHGYIYIKNVGLEANVNSTGNQNGAFVGNNWGGTIKLNVENSYNTGNVVGNSSCLMGGWSNWEGHVFTNVYNIGDIEGHDNYKFVYGDDGQATFTNCYTTCTEKNDDIPGLTQEISSQFIHSGELCAALGAAFTQDLSQEGHPTFGSKTVNEGRWFNNAATDVYYNQEGGNTTVYQLNLDETMGKYAVPANVTAKHVKMARSIAPGKWNTFCSPVAMSKDAFLAVKEFTGAVNSGSHYTLTFSDVDGELEAGKPYMVKVPDAITELTATDVEVAEAPTPVTHNGVTYEGVFTNGYAPEGSYIISNNAFYLVNSKVVLKAFRGDFTVSGAGVKSFDLMLDGDDETAIDDVDGNVNGNGQAIYNMAGQKLSKLQKGINIVNGKKVLF